MADNKETVYNTRTLSKWFALSAIVLLVVTVWAVLQDYDRDWKRYARQNQKIQAAIGEARLKAAQQAMDKSKLDGIRKQIADLEKSQSDLAGQLDEKIARRDAAYYRANQDFQFAKAELDAKLFIVDKAIEERQANAGKLRAEYEHQAKRVSQLKDIATVAERNRDTAIAEKNDFLSQQKKLKDELASLTRDRDRLEKVVAQNEQSLGNLLRNAPVVDFVAPTVKITQLVLPNLKDDYFFNKVPRVDRCMTCHATANKAGFENFPQPFKTHPNLDLILGDNSPHPLEKIGCTTCHAGIPQSVDFSLAAHTPKDLQQEAEWKERYGYYRPHHVPTPMIPTAMTEGKCLQCHAQQVQLAGAPTFNAGMRLIEREGCYGCHKFAGHFEQLAKEKKPGPTLKMIASKVSPEWIRKWLWEPKFFRPTTLMPQYWKNHNNSDPESMARNTVEIDAISTYLMKKAVAYQPLPNPQSAPGDVAHGKQLVGSIGCLGCHAVDDFPRKNPTDPKALGYRDPRIPNFGPELNQLGSKVSKEWLYSWLINPKHYWEGTAMPSLKLSSTEANDIAAYLLTKRNVPFENAKAPAPDDKVRDKVVLTYFQAQMPAADAQTKLASMSLEDKQLFLGEKLIGHYGCYGCHAISGFEKTPQIGAELTFEGSKDVSKFAFENVDIDETRHDWIYTKIRTPRIWDVGKDRDFEGKTRMPMFNLTHEQATAIAAIVLGHENKNVDDEATFKIDGRWEQIIAGERQINRHNCVGCHAIEKQRGDILAHYPEDITLGPPNLNTEGRKAQTRWLYDFLMNPDVMIRPWLKVRMPQFQLSHEEALGLTKYFAAYDNAAYPFEAKQADPMTAADEKAVNEIITKQGCMTCHAVRKPGEDVSQAAPHFANIKARLRGPWVAEWLHNPQAIMPGTRMPTLWPSTNDDDPKAPRVAVPGYFGDDADKQIEMVRNYLFRYPGQADYPSPRPVPGAVPNPKPAVAAPDKAPPPGTKSARRGKAGAKKRAG